MIFNLDNNKFFLISIGAIPGAFIRVQIDQNFFVNLIGCFLIGMIIRLNLSKKNKLVFAVGFCGSLTTFSGWILNLDQMINNGLLFEFILNLIVIILSGLTAIYFGNKLGEKITKLN